MPQVERARMLMRHDEWWEEAAVWIPRAAYLVTPIAFMRGGLAVWNVPTRRTDIVRRKLPCYRSGSTSSGDIQFGQIVAARRGLRR
jgi:hypothetical protein